MQGKAIFAFDFSINKPAMAAYVNGKLELHVFPSSLDSVSIEKLSACDIRIHNRNMVKIKDVCTTENELICEHVRRASELADMIISEMKDILKTNGLNESDAIVSNEGRSFASNGNAALDLTGYKYIFMMKLHEAGFTNFRTYSPMTIKSTAGCSKKGSSKNNMIESVGTRGEISCKFAQTIASNPNSLKKKSNYVTCMDDIADAYWCLITTIEKN